MIRLRRKPRTLVELLELRLTRLDLCAVRVRVSGDRLRELLPPIVHGHMN